MNTKYFKAKTEEARWILNEPETCEICGKHNYCFKLNDAINAPKNKKFGCVECLNNKKFGFTSVISFLMLTWWIGVVRNE